MSPSSANAQPDSEDKPFPLAIKLLLNTAMLGNESVLAFITIMSLPVLQSLGVSLKYASLLYIVEGALSAATIPVMGIISDGGENPWYGALQTQKVPHYKPAQIKSILSDKARKVPLVLLVNAISFVGGVIIIVAVFLRLSNVPQAEKLEQILSSNLTNSLQTAMYPDVYFDHATVNFSDGLGSESNVSWLTAENSTKYLGASEMGWTSTTTAIAGGETGSSTGETGSSTDGTGGSTSDYVSSTSGSITDVAILGMLGFGVLALGYDTTNAGVKSCAITCSPRAAQTSVLLLGLLLAAVGGCSSAVLGSLDLTALVSTAKISNTVLLKASIHIGIVMGLIVVGTFCTALTARFALKQCRGYTTLEESPPQSQTHLPPHVTYTHIIADSTVLQPSVQTDSTFEEPSDSTAAVQSSVRAYGTFDASRKKPGRPDLAAGSRKETFTDSADFNISIAMEQKDHNDSSDFCSDKLSVRSQLGGLREENKMAAETIFNQNAGNKNMAAEQQNNNSGENKAIATERALTGFGRDSVVLPESSSADDLCKTKAPDIKCDVDDIPLCPKDKPNDKSKTVLSALTRFMQALREKSGRNLVPVCLATYFAVGVMQGFNMFIADFLGKEVFGGVPAADPESEKATAYYMGVRLASRGTFISYIAFGLINIFNNKFLKHIGMKKEFVFVHVLFAGGLVWMVLSGSLVAFYINAFLVGIQRSLTYSLPFDVAADYSHQSSASSGKRGARVGTAIAIVSCMIPLANCTLYSWFGPLAARAGPGAPMYAAASCALLSSALFASYGHL